MTIKWTFRGDIACDLCARTFLAVFVDDKNKSVLDDNLTVFACEACVGKYVRKLHPLSRSIAGQKTRIVKPKYPQRPLGKTRHK